MISAIIATKFIIDFIGNGNPPLLALHFQAVQMAEGNRLNVGKMNPLSQYSIVAY